MVNTCVNAGEGHFALSASVCPDDDGLLVSESGC